MKWFHVDPDEAVRIHQDINSARSLAVHWGTFRDMIDSRHLIHDLVPFGFSRCYIVNWSVESILASTTRLTYEPYLEPRTRLRKALDEAGIDPEDFQV